MSIKKAVIVGSGIAGLATAIRLKNQDFDVAVFEMNDSPGGKLSEIRKNEYRFDCGPSLFTMPQYVEELFSVSGKEIKDYFQYIKKDTICNYFYEDGTRFIAEADQKKFAESASKFFDVTETQVLKYFENSKRKYDLTSSLFLEKSLHTLATYLSKDTLNAITKINSLDINKTLNQVNQREYKDPKLIQFFNRFATYNGSSPYRTPGIMSMIPHLEQYYGAFFPKGGMYSIAKSLYMLAKDLGVKFHFKTKVNQIIIKDQKAKAVLTDKGVFDADVVISNMDIVPTYQKMLPNHKAPQKILKQQRSSSALIFYWGIRKNFHQLDLHNVFFSKDYEFEFECVFNKKQVSKDPTVYINITSKNEPSDAPEGCENWFVMINVPSNQGQNWNEIIKESRKNILQKLSRLLSEDIESLIQNEEVLDPRKIEENTYSFQGSLYGSSSNNKFAAFLRHPNFSRKIKNLYFCGGSVHPGGGIPLCLLSGKIVSELIQKDFKFHKI